MYREFLKNTTTEDCHENVAWKSDFIFFSVSIVIIPARLLCQIMHSNYSGAEFLQPYPSSWREWILSLRQFTSFTKREIRHFHGLRRTVDGKEMYKKAWCSCKVVVLPCQAIVYLTFLSPPHLKLPIIYDTLWSVKNRIFSGQIQLLLLIASQTFFSTHRQFLRFWIRK